MEHVCIYCHVTSSELELAKLSETIFQVHLFDIDFLFNLTLILIVVCCHQGAIK